MKIISRNGAARVGFRILGLLGCLPLLAGCATGRPSPDAELRALTAKVPRFQVVGLPAAGHLILRADQGLSIEDLRGVRLDDAPPQLGPRSAEFAAKLGDSAHGPTPYVARQIAPFRFKYFDCEFHYDGMQHHLWPMYEYAATHGFNRFGAYRLTPADWTHLPAGSEWVLLSGCYWADWFKQHGLEGLRWDKLAEARAPGEELFKPGAFPTKPGYAMIMIDQEYGGLLPVEELRRQPWYPASADPAARTAFEDRYYLGYALGLSVPGDASHRDGWSRASVYAWQPFLKSWYGLDPRIRLDPATEPWAKRFLDKVYDAYDVIHIDGYCTAVSAGNVAYTLSATDDALAYARTRDRRKPIRMYLSTAVLAGPPGSQQWLHTQPLRNEEMRAIAALQLFTGVDGFVQWNWAENENHLLPAAIRPPEAGKIWNRLLLQAGEPFAATRDNRSGTDPIWRYDLLRVVETNATGQVRFCRVDPAKPDATPETGAPVFVMPGDELTRHLRPTAEPVAAMIEGLALVKPLEYILSHGDPVIDVPARRQYDERLPIVRRVKLGDLNIVATYDPQCAYGEKPRSIILENFDGRTGRTLELPADEQVRIFVLRQASK